MLHIVKRIEKLTNLQISIAMIGFSLILVLIGSLIMWQSSNKGSSSASDDTVLTVATTIFPLADIVRNVGGDRVEVVQLLPSGASPHSYDLTPSQVAELSKSEVLFVIGHGLDDWAQEFATSNGVDVEVVDTDINLISSEDNHEDEEEDEDHGNIDPHYWLTLPNGMIISRNVKDSLSTLFPEYAEEFEANNDVYVSKLAKADIEMRKQLNSETKQIAVFHGGWDYLARNYGFMIVAEFEEFPGKEPTPGYVADFQNEIILNNVKTIFVEPQLSTDAIRPLASDLGVNLVLLDPLGDTSNAPTYLELMRYNISQIISSN